MRVHGETRISCFDTRISKSGQGIAFLCKEMGMQCAVGYPKLKEQRELNEPQAKAKEMGAKVFAVQAGRTAPCYAAFKREMLSQGYAVLPLGITFKETAEEVAKISEKETEKFGTIVLSTGTGTIACGVAMGTNAKVIGVSCGMNIEKQWKRINTIAGFSPHNLILIPTSYDYYEKERTDDIPFPSSPYYDAKAWVWLLRNIDKLTKPILFWNIGV
jgi:1-aminocyclopropane-1-carboxylate deaminase/D-cysteine desulfhydrase-like pyridoxal-dependent ACC family enzyme